jgi:hypothetical protein
MSPRARPFHERASSRQARLLGSDQRHGLGETDRSCVRYPTVCSGIPSAVAGSSKKQWDPFGS